MSGCDAVYRERAHLLGLLAAVFPSHLQPDPAEPDWPVLYINLPTGQCTWHIGENDIDLFAHVRRDVYEPWDGHTTEEKYARVDGTTELVVMEEWWYE